MKNDPVRQTACQSVRKAENGMVTLEACIFVTMFMLIMILLLGLFQMFLAQNITAHVLLQTAESLSLDAYATSKLKGDDAEAGGLGPMISGFIVGFFGNQDQDPAFVTDEAWYDGKGSRSFANVVQTRFVGFLTEGDDGAANRYLNLVRIADGLSGLDFSETEIVNGDLKIVLKYDLKYSFQIGSHGTVPVRQTAVSRLWADNADSKNQTWNEGGHTSIVPEKDKNLSGFVLDIIYGPFRDGSSGLLTAAAGNKAIEDMIEELRKFDTNGFPFTEAYLLNAPNSVFGFGHNAFLLVKENGQALYCSYGPSDDSSMISSMVLSHAMASFAVLDKKQVEKLLNGDKKAPLTVGLYDEDIKGWNGQDDHIYNNSFRIPITDDEGVKMARKIAGTVAAPGTYGVLVHQCADVANDILMAGDKGLEVGEQNITGIPNWLFQAIQEKYS